MNANYTTKTAALKTVTHDSNIITTNKLFVNIKTNDGKVEKTDIINLLQSKNYALYKEMTEKLVHNGIYHLNEMESINFALEEELDDLFSCEVVFTSGATPTVVSSDSRIKWVGDDVNAGVFTPVANVRYSCSLQYDGVFVRGMTFGIPTV